MRETYAGGLAIDTSHGVSIVSASDETLGRNLRDARLAAGLSQQQLGELVGINRTRVSEYEHSRYKPSLERLRVIAHATGQTVEWFFQEHDIWVDD